jgi:hypothetical protein
MIASWSTWGGRPARLVVQPGHPTAFIGVRQSITVGRDTPTRLAISVLLTPSAASSTIRARCANPARSDDDRAQPVNRSRSPS